MLYKKKPLKKGKFVNSPSPKRNNLNRIDQMRTLREKKVQLPKTSKEALAKIIDSVKPNTTNK